MTIDKIDVTDQVTGWSIPDGWTVTAEMHHDYHSSPDDADCYTDTQKRAWRNDEWSYVGVVVTVSDSGGREWGTGSIWGTEYGSFTLTDEQDNVTGTVWLDPLNAPEGEYNVVREYDLIGEALAEAAKALEEFGAPVITEV